MHKNKSALYIIGCLLIGVTVLLLLYMALIFTGVIDMRANRLVIQAGSAEKEYDGSPLSCNEWSIAEGELRAGHSLSVTVEGELTAVGSAPNRAFAQIVDAGGNDVTKEYALELRDGTLSVLGIRLVLRSASASMPYNGQTLTASGWEFVSGRFLSGHRLGPVSVTGSITEVGQTPNTISATVLDGQGRDVSQNYALIYETGTLCIQPIALTVTTSTMEWKYTGETFSHEQYTLAVGSLFAGDHMDVQFLRSLREIGKVDNEVRITVTDRNGLDVTSRYDIELILGHLAVFAELGDSDDIDGDGWKDILQDYDGDGIPDHWLDTDGDGKPDTAPNSPGLQDSDGNGVLDMYEDVDGNGIYDVLEDSDGNGKPDWWQDDNGDGVPDLPDTYTNLDESGSIANDDEARENTENNQTTAVVLQSDYTGAIYLRYLSYGDYDARGGSWQRAEAFDHEGYVINPVYLSAVALQNAGYGPQRVSIYLNGKQHLEPYYTTTPSAEGNDVLIPLQGEDPYRYTLSYIPFYDVSNAESLLSDALRAEYRQLETAYRAFVYEQYLYVPSETSPALRTLMAKNGLYRGKDGLVDEVARVIRACATYDMGVNDPEEPCDIVTYFLTESKTGVCRHFASAATLLFRELGIPARYVGGYMGQTVAGQTVELTGANAHAWVEIYLDGIGWMPVEVTPASANDDNPGDNDDSDSSLDTSKPGQILSRDPNALTLRIRPETRYKTYDGLPLTCPETDAVYYFEESDTPRFGHTVHIKTSGSQTDVGTSQNWITDVWVEDESGRDVTDQYNIYYNIPGEESAKLRVLAITLLLTSADADARAADTPRLTCHEVSCNTPLLPGHTIEYHVTGEQIGIGESDNTFTYTLYETVGGVKRALPKSEYEKYYEIGIKYGKLKLHRGVITVTMHGATRVYDGNPLEAVLEIDDSQLEPGHTIGTIAPISQTEIGTLYIHNQLKIVVHAGAANVASEYKINLVAGTNQGRLTVQPRTLSVRTIGNSAIFDFDNPNMEVRPLGVETVDISNLLDGHYIVEGTLQATGVQSTLGSSPAKLANTWVVRDANNNDRDVTRYYTMAVIEGELEILAP